jgi:hypothetical protein
MESSGTNWNPSGGGFKFNDFRITGDMGSHWQNFGHKPIFLLTDEDRDIVLAVREFRFLPQAHPCVTANLLIPVDRTVLPSATTKAMLLSTASTQSTRCLEST